MDRAISFVLLTFLCTNVQSCSDLPTPVITAYDDGWIRITIPPVSENINKYGIDYEIYRGDEILDAGANDFSKPYSQGQKFGVRHSGPSPLGNRVKYSMYEGKWSNRTCVGKSNVFLITALLPSESYKN